VHQCSQEEDWSGPHQLEDGKEESSEQASMSCPVCEKRAALEQKAASDCKQEVKQLETKSARLTIVLTVLSTLVGKELLDEALALTDSIATLSAAPLVEKEVVQANPANGQPSDTNDKPEERVTVIHTVPTLTSLPDLFPSVPALTPRLYETTSVGQMSGLYFDDNIVVPDSVAPLFLTAMFRPWTGRKRK
jgi:hypothetical protein